MWDGCCSGCHQWSTAVVEELFGVHWAAVSPLRAASRLWPHLARKDIVPTGTWVSGGSLHPRTSLIFSFLSKGGGCTSLSLHVKLSWVQGAVQGGGWDRVGTVFATGVVPPISAYIFIDDFTTQSLFPGRKDLYELFFKELYIEFTFWSVVVFHPSLASRHQ